MYQAPVSKHFLLLEILSGLGVCMWDGSPGGGSLWMAFPSVSAPLFVPIFPLDRNNSGLKFGDEWVAPFLKQRAMPNLWIWSWTFRWLHAVPHPPMLHISIQFPDPLYVSPVSSISSISSRT